MNQTRMRTRSGVDLGERRFLYKYGKLAPLRGMASWQVGAKIRL
jgi:hypothetical protein